jgi:hypothetical protein
MIQFVKIYKLQIWCATFNNSNLLQNSNTNFWTMLKPKLTKNFQVFVKAVLYLTSCYSNKVLVKPTTSNPSKNLQSNDISKMNVSKASLNSFLNLKKTMQLTLLGWAQTLNTYFLQLIKGI